MEKKYLSWGQKIAYGSGDMGSNFMYTMVSSFVMLYLTNALGLNAGVVGTLMMVSKLFDGVTDLFFGAMIDRTKSRFGKARPWMLWSILPLAVCEFMLFSIPEMSQTLQYVYFFILYTLVNAVCYTASNIAYSTMSALITRNGNERVQLGSIRFIMALVSSLFVSTYTIELVEYFGGGIGGWRIISGIYALLLAVCMLVTVIFIKELPAEETDGDTSKRAQKTSALQDFKLLLTNKFYLNILGFSLARYLGAGIGGGVMAYFALYVLKNAKLIGVMAASSRIPVLICLTVTPLLVKKYGVYRINLAGRVFGLLFAVGTAVFGYMGSFVGLVVCSVCSSLLSNSITGTLNSVIADTARYTYLKDKRHVEGTIFSCSSIGLKIGTGLGTAACGWLLELGGYDGMAQTQPDSAVAMISFMYLVIPVILQMAMLLFTAGLNVDKANRELEQNVRKY